MANQRLFEEQYSLNIARLKPGKQEESFVLDRSFFEHFDFGLSQDGQVNAHLDIHKFDSHIDVKFHLSGTVQVPCDRCLEPFSQPIDTTHRIVYSFDPNQKFNGTEVLEIKEEEPLLSVAQEFYDFVHVSLPLRRVPPKDIHTCDPAVLEVLGIDEYGNPVERPKTESSEDDIDPRWEALKKLKEKGSR